MASVFSISILFHLAGTPIGVLRLLDRFDLLTAQNVITSGVSLVGSTVVYAMGGGIWGFLVLLLLSSLLSSLLMWGMAFTAMRERGLAAHWRAPVGKWKPFVRFSMWRYLSSAFDIPVKQLDVIIVSTVISLEATGIYRIIKQVLGVLGLWTGPVYQAVFPQFATMIAKRDNEGAIKYAVKIGVLSFASVGLPAVMLAVTSTWWLDMVFGAGFAAGAAPLSVFLFFQVFAIGATVIHPLFTAMGYVKQNSVILLLANATYLGLAWQLSKAWGLSGLGLAFGVQLSLIVVLKAVYIARRQSSGVPVA